MKRMKRWMGLLVCLFLTAVMMVPPSSAADKPAMVVGRVYYIEGDLLRYVPAEKDWVAMVKDAPFGTEDTLFSGNRGMAEMIVPNGTWIRVWNSTQIQFIALDSDLSETDVASGVARFYNKSSRTVIKATGPFGYVLAYPGAVFDFYVGENSVEVVAVKGTVSFVHSATNVKYDISAGSPSILTDQNQVSSGEGTVDPDWDRWNTGRETFWAAKVRVGGRSVGYLPPSLQPEAYALEENGRWESVLYEGRERWFWRPTTVAVGWSPFTAGRWTDWDGDQTWIPEEPFGYVTHHYGNWVYARNNWYWAPPVVSVRVGLPPPRHRLLLESWKGFMDSQWSLCGLGASGAARDVLQPPQLGRPSRCGRNQRQSRADQHQPPELCLRKPCHRSPPERLLRCEQLQECTGDQHKPCHHHQQLPCGACRQ